jgi:replicative DNA helicase
MTEIEARATGATGMLTGYDDLDRETGGFRDGELIILAGAEKMGKSAVALNIALNVSERTHANGGGAVGYVSAEMTREQLTERCLSVVARVDGKKLSTGKLVNEDWPKLARAAGYLLAAPLHIDDEAEPSLADVVARCTHLKATHPDVRLLVVDFLQLIHDREKGVTEATELKRIAYGLKAMAKRLKVVVIAPCQVNTKDVENTKAEPRPQLKDLQGSSGMRQAADFVALLFRPAAYDSIENTDPAEMELFFAACRRTGKFRVKLRWDDATQAIGNWGPR